MRAPASATFAREVLAELPVNEVGSLCRQARWPKSYAQGNEVRYVKRSRGRNSVQQEKRGGIFGAGTSVKDRETIDLHRAIRSVVFHVMFPSLILGVLRPQRKRCKRDGKS